MIRCGPAYGLSVGECRARVERVVEAIERHWPDAADRARLTSGERTLIWRRLILNPAATRDPD